MVFFRIVPIQTPYKKKLLISSMTDHRLTTKPSCYYLFLPFGCCFCVLFLYNARNALPFFRFYFIFVLFCIFHVYFVFTVSKVATAKPPEQRTVLIVWLLSNTLFLA
uniref:Uncharacterized protein n=1 Tax=Schizaphis graminum TaxID=13262 RepID=A0A2S2NWW2_SCHGA